LARSTVTAERVRIKAYSLFIISRSWFPKNSKAMAPLVQNAAKHIKRGVQKNAGKRIAMVTRREC
jgi:hypothetical protein